MHLRDEKFSVSCATQSGPTMLRALMRSHPQAICHRELLGQEQPSVSGISGRKSKKDPGLGRQIHRYRDQQPRRFDNVFNAQGRRCVAFKFKTDEAFQPRFKAIREVIAADEEIETIRLIRRNLLNRYGSHQAGEKTNTTLIRPTEKRPQAALFVVDGERAERWSSEAH